MSDVKVIPLVSLAAGQKAKITAIDLPSDQRGRVMEMGLTIGTTVEFLRRAPMGDPLAFRVRGASVSLRGADAEKITVEVV